MTTAQVLAAQFMARWSEYTQPEAERTRPVIVETLTWQGRPRERLVWVTPQVEAWLSQFHQGTAP